DQAATGYDEVLKLLTPLQITFRAHDQGLIYLGGLARAFLARPNLTDATRKNWKDAVDAWLVVDQLLADVPGAEANVNTVRDRAGNLVKRGLELESALKTLTRPSPTGLPDQIAEAARATSADVWPRVSAALQVTFLAPKQRGELWKAYQTLS